MANTLSAKKRIRQNERRRKRNQVIRSRTKTHMRNALEAIQSGDVDLASEAVHKAIRELDKSATRGVLHHNNAARRKSRLMKKLNALKEDSTASD